MCLLYRLSLRAKHGSVNDQIRGRERQHGLTVSLNNNEVITEATVTHGEYVCSLMFCTSSSRVFGPYNYSYHNCSAKNIDIKKSTVKMGRLLYFIGRDGEWLDTIGFAYND